MIEKDLEKKAIDFVWRLYSEYFYKKDLSFVKQHLNDDVVLFGIANDCVIKSAKEFESKSEKLMEVKDDWGFEKVWENVRQIGSKYVIIFGEYIIKEKACENKAEQLNMSVRNTFVLATEKDSFKLVHAHISKPTFTLDEKNFFSLSRCRSANESLQEKIERKEIVLKDVESQLRIIVNNIPGGVVKCLTEKGLPIVYASDLFLETIGYSQEELKSLFDNNFVNIINDEDALDVEQSFFEQLYRKGEVKLMYRIKNKMNKNIWIAENAKLIHEIDGNAYCICIFTDVTALKERQNQILHDQEKYMNIAKYMNGAVFEWDAKKDVLNLSDNGSSMFDGKTSIENPEKFLANSNLIHIEDRDKIAKLVVKLKNGDKNIFETFRLKLGDSDTKWFAVRGATSTDSEGKVLKAIGCIFDVDTIKKESEDFKLMTLRDSLSGLYNNNATRSIIEKILQISLPTELGVMMVVDIDDFKNINDKMGHLIGDSVINEVAGVLNSCFKQNAVIGRVGGDEFVVYINDVISINSAIKKLSNVIENVKRKITADNKSMDLTVSIGASMFSKDGLTYEELFKKADDALYQSKQKGKNTFTIFE